MTRPISWKNCAPNVRPHVAQNTSRRRSAIDGRTTRHTGYATNRPLRKRIEEAFAWIKMVAGLREAKLRGIGKVGWTFSFAAEACNLARLQKLLDAPSLRPRRTANSSAGGGSSRPICENAITSISSAPPP